MPSLAFHSIALVGAASPVGAAVTWPVTVVDLTSPARHRIVNVCSRKEICLSKSPVRETTDQRRLGFPFRSGNLCLDFVATVAKRDMSDREMLVDAEALQTWLYVAGLPSATDLDDGRLDAARELREAINALTRARVDGLRPPATAVDIVNRAGASAPPAPALAYDAATLRPTDPSSTDSVLAVVAREAIDLFSGPFQDRIRRCLGHDCSLYFIDQSRQGSRRWCSMASCGEKASSAAYRQRHRTR